MSFINSYSEIYPSFVCTGGPPHHWYSPKLSRNPPQFRDLMGVPTESPASYSHDQRVAISCKRRDVIHEQESRETKKNRITSNKSAGDARTRKKEESPQLQLEGVFISQPHLTSSGITFRFHIYYNGSIHFNKSSCWTTHHVSGEMKLCDLFLLHHLKGGPQPHGTVVLQQVDRCMMMSIAGTDLYWFSPQNLMRITDTNWLFNDNEAWLRCSTH